MGTPANIIAIMGKSTIDSNAQAFITAAGIANATQISAINNLVKALKTAGIWNKFTAIYPFVGGNAIAHSYNLVNTAQYQITFAGTVTHSANGIQGNGTNGYANTNLLGSTLPQNDNHLSVYIRTNATDPNYDIGTAITGTRVLGFRSRNGVGSIEAYNNDLTLITATNSFPTGLQLHQRTASNAVAFYVGNGGLMSSNTSVSTGTIAFNIFIGSVNISGSPSGYNARQYAFASMGQSLNATERTAFYNAVQAFQTTLGRSMGTQTVSDADAQAFINSANIQDQVQATAINDLVISLKSAGIWSKCNAIYPFVGGSASAHSYNLKNPAQYQLSFTGGWTHSANGALPNGTNAYANTGLNGSTVLTQSNTHLSFYSRTNPAAAARIAMGSYNDLTAPNPIFVLALKNAAGNLTTANANQSAGQLVSVANTDSRGFYVSNKTSASIGGLVIDKNGTQVASNSSAITTNSYANLNIFIGASSLSSSTAFQYDLKECAFASIGLGLSATERTDFNTIVQTYQTTLSRNV